MTRHSLPVARSSTGHPLSTLAGRHPLSLLTVAVALSLGTLGSDVHALALGRLNIQSALGEPLRAEIDVSEITAAEADGLKIGMASREAFQAAGVAFNDSLSSVRAALQRRSDGRYVVRLTGSRPMNEPFVDILLEANWASGRIVRDYTLLLDPPSTRQAGNTAPITPIAPQVTPAPTPRVSAAPSGDGSAGSTPRRARPTPAAPAESRVRTEGTSDQQVTVRAGDTASRIAASVKPTDVSLDQMLLALLRANPEAFINGNVNRIKAGAVLQVPNAATANATPVDEARRTLSAQSRNFGDYRRRLAENAPTSRTASADQQASGRLQANVEDRNATATAPDKLTVSQGGAVSGNEDKLAQARQAQESGKRAEELSRNINELNTIQKAGTGDATTAPPTAGPAPAPAAAAAAPAASTPADAGVATPAAAEASAPDAPTASAAPAAPAAPPVAAPPPAPPPVEPGFMERLMQNPILLGGGALLLVLLGFLLYRFMGRKKQDMGDSVFPESRLPKDSFFGATGGESVDTKSRNSSMVSSLSYTPSQLDAGDVDPVAEADVYLAYGRDLQAEEILREALRTTPDRTAIHLKLLEIQAKRRDLRAFEALANDVHKLTGGSGPDWSRVLDMGRELDPGNPLYQSATPSTDGTRATPAVGAGISAAAAMSPVATAAPAAVEPPPPFVPSVAPLDFDLDLAKPSSVAPLVATAPVAAATAPAPFASTSSPAYESPRAVPTASSSSGTTAQPAAARMPPVTPVGLPELDNDFDTAPAELEPVRKPPAALRAGLPEESGFIEFDMSAMAPMRADRGDTYTGALETTQSGTLSGRAASGESPQAIKLSLARELQALGDTDGARSLVEEVANESTGEMRQQAQQLLAQLR